MPSAGAAGTLLSAVASRRLLCASQGGPFRSSSRSSSSSRPSLASIRPASAPSRAYPRASLAPGGSISGVDLPPTSPQPLVERVAQGHFTLPQKSALQARAAPTVAMASAATALQPLEVVVKAAAGHPDTLGDCPFSQRVLLALEESSIPYDRKLVDTGNKPQWFLEANPEGKVPVIKLQGSWLADSDAIVAALIEDFPEAKKLENSPEQSSVASGLFGAFARFLRGTGAEEDLLGQLKALDDGLGASGGPFVAGKEFTAVDARLAPALYHIETALGHFKQWSIPAEYKHVLAYIEAIHSRDSWKKTVASPEAVVAGWSRALGVTS